MGILDGIVEWIAEQGFWLKHLKKAGKKDRIKAINR